MAKRTAVSGWAKAHVTRTAYDAKLDAIERIERQVRRYDGAEAADLIVYGGVPIKDLAWTELEPEEIASAAMGGVTEGDEFRPGLPSAELRAAWSQWEARDDYGRVAAIELDHRSRPGWMRAATGAAWVHIELYGFHQRSWRPVGKTWSQIESLAGGEGRR